MHSKADFYTRQFRKLLSDEKVGLTNERNNSDTAFCTKKRLLVSVIILDSSAIKYVQSVCGH